MKNLIFTYRWPRWLVDIRNRATHSFTKMRALANKAAIALICIGAQINASAAIITINDKFGTSITLSGEITAGDAESIAKIFINVKSTIHPSGLYLNSPGGDVAEAIRIAELVKSLGINVATA